MSDQKRVEQEMQWLFGDDWRDMAGTEEYAYALSRIQERRRGWGWFVVASILLTLVGLFMLGMYDFIIGYGEPLVELVCLSAGLILFAIVLIGAFLRFPTARRLEARERKAGDEFLSRHEKHKKLKTKPKREYALGADGELVEIEVDSARDAIAKPKWE